MVTVQVLWKNSGTPAIKQQVSCRFGRRWGDNKTTDVTTNESGEAYFDVTPVSGEISINGSTMYRGIISGKIIVYLEN